MSRLRPIGLLTGAAAAAAVTENRARWLAGGPVAFLALERHRFAGDGAERSLVALAEVTADALDALAAPRAPWAGFRFGGNPGRPVLMGIVNVTPDSFSDGGRTADAAIAHGRALRAAGADILDVGGESTRPGAEPVAAAVERERVLPVVRALAADGAVVSIDSRHADVMEAALAAGARIVNDVTALEGEGSLAVVARAQCPVVLMHRQGDFRTMQDKPAYRDVTLEVADYLARRLDSCLAAGIAPERIALDPGIGFGKTVDHNLALLREVALLHGLGRPLLVGASRKGFIGRLSRGEPASERLGGSLAVALVALGQGVQLLRVHDVAETAQACALWTALSG